MLEIVKVIDSKPDPTPGQIWERETSKYLINSVNLGVVWAYKLSPSGVTETAIDVKNAWRFKLFTGSREARDQIIDAMADALYEQDDMENSERIYELSKLEFNSLV